MLKDITYFFKISRPINLLISGVSFFIAAFFAKHHSFNFVADYHFWGVLLVILLIAAGGYWINDVYDFRIDRINKPDKAIVNTFLSVKKVLTVYWVMHFLLFAIVVWFVPFSLTFIFVSTAIVLFIYAAWLKRVSLIGNVVVAALTSLVILCAGYLYEITLSLAWMMMFAFEINLIREIVKDVEDIKGDLAFKLQTLPIQIGLKRTKYVLYFLYICLLVSCYVPVVVEYLKHQTLLVPYLSFSILAVQLPTLYLIYLLYHAINPSEYKKQSTYIKVIMLAGIVNLVLLAV
ncbi:MAG: geranylgeranylglycerol-phosphate geranylgeranyltransferase [Bacteroidia bacterium]